MQSMDSETGKHMKNVIISCLIILEFIFSTTCFAVEPVSEYQVKAGFIYKLLFFAEWPSEAFNDNKTTVMIGILAKDNFGDIFKSVEGQVINKRKLVIKKIDKIPQKEELRQFHILFISPSLKDKMGSILSSLKGFPVLTVSEVKGFIHLGGMVNFITQENKVGFEINRTAAESAGIMFSSKLLRVAIRVIEY